MRQKSNGKQQFIIKRAAGFLLLIFAFTGIIGICVEKKDNRIRADSGMETERMAEENTKAASGKIKEEEVKKVALTFDDDVIIGLSQEISAFCCTCCEYYLL